MKSRVLLSWSVVGAAVPALSLVGAGSPVTAAGHHRVTDVQWVEPATETGGVASFDVRLDGGRSTSFRVRVTGGQVNAIPAGCEPSTVVAEHSRIGDDGTSLVCDVAGGRASVVRVYVRPASSGGQLTAHVDEDGQARDLPTLPIRGGRTDSARTLRLLSSPDFLNADVGDPPGPARGTNSAYDRALARVLDDWASKDPDAVLVAGDLVNGHWDRDDRHRRVFGPVRTRADQARAIHRAAATYYPQYLERFSERGLDLYPAIGDHEYGDNPWPGAKRRLAPVYAREFARHFTRGFSDHPRGRHAGTAYAWRPAPDVQVVSIDQFDITAGHAKLRLDAPQLRWLEGVLRKARAEGVRWTIVQGHLPVLQPVRSRGSSELHYAGGARSRLWRLFERYGVDLYLAGEVHDTTASEHGGVVQLAHGGAFQFGLTTYALLDVREDRIDISLEDYSFAVRMHGPRLWETARAGLPASIRVDPTPYTIGTLTLGADGTLSRRSGILTRYRS